MADALRTLRVVHFGDSITYGQHLDPAVRWTSLVQRRLTPGLPPGVALEVVNAGVPGDTTRIALERFPADIQKTRPDVVTIQFGMNDCNCWQTDAGLPRVSLEAYQANLREMITRARHFGCQQLIFCNNHRTLRTSPMVSGEAYESANARYSRGLEAVAREMGVAFCDVRAAFEALPDETVERFCLPPPDRLHLSEPGNEFYADVVLPYLEQSIRTCLNAGDALAKSAA
jgi:lysophospholipase L1-like esterase